MSSPEAAGPGFSAGPDSNLTGRSLSRRVSPQAESYVRHGRPVHLDE
jgi:hypothetical protein